MLRLMVAVAFSLAFWILYAILTPAPAFDSGQYKDVPDNIRQWFKSVRSPHGVPCCDVADGRRTEWDMRPDGYYVPPPKGPSGKENWIRVPPETVINNAGNPVGDAVVWYMADHRTIRCFVPGNGV